MGAESEERKECGGGRHPSVLRGCDLQTRLCQGLSTYLVVQEPHVCPWVTLTELSHCGWHCWQSTHCLPTCFLCSVALLSLRPGPPSWLGPSQGLAQFRLHTNPVPNWGNRKSWRQIVLCSALREVCCVDQSVKFNWTHPGGLDGKKNLPAVWETQVWSLGWEDPVEKDMATHTSILAWRMPWTEEPGRLQSMGLQRVRHDWVTNTLTFTTVLGKGHLSHFFWQLGVASWLGLANE